MEGAGGREGGGGGEEKIREEEERREVGGERGWRVAFWNIAGIGGKDKEFWEGIKNWDIVIMSETWMERRTWERTREKLPKEFEWRAQMAERRNKRGRACGGMLMGIRKGMREGEGEKSEREERGRIMERVKMGEEEWRIIGVYVNGDMKEKLEGLKEWMEESEEGVRTIIGGDFNARTGNMGGWGEEEEGEEGGRGRKSKDKKINKEGRRLIKAIEERGWMIYNGSVEGDEEGEYTYTGCRGETVIDYVIGNREVKDKIKKMEVGDKIDSDHQPVVIWIKGKGEEEGRGKDSKRRMRGVWDKEGREEFRRGWEEGGGEKDGEEEEREKGQERIRKIIEEGERKRGGKKKKGRGWWDKECKENKKRVRKELRRWRREGGGGERYREERHKYKELCEEKRRQERERTIKEVEEAKTEGKIWKLIRGERRGRRKINERIRMEEWKEHFMGLLGGVEGRVVKGQRRKGRKSEEREIEWEEVKRAMGKLKEGKAIGRDGIPNEVWKYGGEEVGKWAWKMCNKVWRGEGWPKEWEEGTIIPIIKKGNGEEVREYRGVTLMPSLYRIYAMILEERLREELERKGILSESQAGFRRGRGTVDNIYIVNYLVNRQLGKKEGKMTALFIDLKAAFDSVDRGVLIRTMRERGIREGLVERTEEIMRETRSRVKVGEEEGEEFWTGKGLRQGCPLSPTLFNIMLADLEEEMERGGWGGVKLGERKIYTLTYADDVVVLAEEEQEMRMMIGKLERYLNKKGLELNAEKTKIIRFRKGGGRKKKIEWRWKGKKLEETKEIKYLGYIIKQNGGQEGQIRDRIRKAAIAMREVWGIGKRKWGKDWKRRMWLFDRMVWTVMSYGVEIWGWREWRGMEAMQERYIKWVLGVGWKTPGYMVREELGREMIRSRAGGRAWEYERRLKEGRGSELARRCWEEGKERWKKGRIVGRWEKEREECMKERGMEEGEEEEGRSEEWRRRDEGKQKEERWEKIRNSRYNKWYGRVKKEGIPGYMEKGWAEKRWQRVARWRMGGEVGEGRYWEREEKRVCRVCGAEEETWEHIWERCGRWEGEEEETWMEAVERILGEEGEGEEWMKRMERVRGGWDGGREEEEREASAGGEEERRRRKREKEGEEEEEEEGKK